MLCMTDIIRGSSTKRAGYREGCRGAIRRVCDEGMVQDTLDGEEEKEVFAADSLGQLLQDWTRIEVSKTVRKCLQRGR